jgi:hypothetical protein
MYTGIASVLQAEYSHSWIPFVIFGIVSILGGLLTLLLPETKDEIFPDTFEEAENLGKSRKNKSHDVEKSKGAPNGNDVIQSRGSMAGYDNVAIVGTDNTQL